jgi:hypothetical protein
MRRRGFETTPVIAGDPTLEGIIGNYQAPNSDTKDGDAAVVY